MKIQAIRAFGLRGTTPEGGWSNELRPDDCVHTLVIVRSAAGLAGVGSVFTEAIVRAAPGLGITLDPDALRRHTGGDEAAAMLRDSL